MYMKNMQIIANNIAILWENRFATEDVIIYCCLYERRGRDVCRDGTIYTSRVGSCLHDTALPGRDVRRDDFDVLK
jgi:hypothetical protein